MIKEKGVTFAHDLEGTVVVIPGVIEFRLVASVEQTFEILQSVFQARVLRLVPQSPNPSELAVAYQFVSCNINQKSLSCLIFSVKCFFERSSGVYQILLNLVSF